MTYPLCRGDRDREIHKILKAEKTGKNNNKCTIAVEIQGGQQIIIETMKVVSIAVLRMGSAGADPIPTSMACDLSSYGFFQRQVSSS